MSSRTGQERRSDMQKFIEELTSERAEMLILFCRLAGVAPFYAGENKDEEQTRHLLQSLCQVMVDYLSLGHFSLYERISRGEERRHAITQIASELYPRIAQTTEVALNFNDRYDDTEHCEISGDFEAELSRLGEALATRIDLEDRILQSL